MHVFVLFSVSRRDGLTALRCRVNFTGVLCSPPTKDTAGKRQRKRYSSALLQIQFERKTIIAASFSMTEPAAMF